MSSKKHTPDAGYEAAQYILEAMTEEDDGDRSNSGPLTEDERSTLHDGRTPIVGQDDPRHLGDYLGIYQACDSMKSGSGLPIFDPPYYPHQYFHPSQTPPPAPPLFDPIYYQVDKTRSDLAWLPLLPLPQQMPSQANYIDGSNPSIDWGRYGSWEPDSNQEGQMCFNSPKDWAGKILTWIIANRKTNFSSRDALRAINSRGKIAQLKPAFVMLEMCNIIRRVQGIRKKIWAVHPGALENPAFSPWIGSL